MASTTEQRMALDNAVIACLDAGDNGDDVRQSVDEFIEQWEAENEEGEDGD